jgi:hypothetical protein
VILVHYSRDVNHTAMREERYAVFLRAKTKRLPIWPHSDSECQHAEDRNGCSLNEQFPISPSPEMEAPV